MSGDEAVAFGARLSKPHVISAYPITPQTVTVERISEFVEEGSMKSIFMHVESEHSAITAAMGVSSVGARAFTATSSQGLLYMSEGLHYASGARFPIVMMNANRSVATPWNIYGDQRDSLSQLDCGWIQVYVEDAQEALDMVIQAYKIAEDRRVMTPFMINLDGFVLTHTYELVDIPDQEAVDKFLPPLETDNKMDFDDPKSLCITVGPGHNLEFNVKQHLAMMEAKNVIKEVDREFGKAFGRNYGGLVEEYNTEDAEAVLVTTGSVTGTARVVVDRMRQEGKKVGLLKLRYLRPFPEEEIINLADRVKAIGVIDKDISFGYEGTIYTNVNSALSKARNHPASLNFIAGFGGRDISKDDIESMFTRLLESLEGNEQARVQFIGLGCEIDG